MKTFDQKVATIKDQLWDHLQAHFRMCYNSSCDQHKFYGGFLKHNGLKYDYKSRKVVDS